MMENGTAAAGLWTTSKDEDRGVEMTLILTLCMDSLDQNSNTTGPGISENLEIANVIGYTILVLSTVTNITVFVGMPFKINERDKLCTLHILLRHLVLADLLVTSTFLPKQMNLINMGNFTYGWSSWIASALACRAVAFFSSLGLYSSGFLIVSITLDRCLAVRKRNIASKAVRRAKIMSRAAWTGSVICSGIEAAVYHLEYHLARKELKRCTFAGTFHSWELQFAYASMERVLSFGFPLVMILICYPCMLWRTCSVPLEDLSRNARTNGGGRRAGRRTMKVSIAVVFLFPVCWAPYNIMYLWAFVDRRFHFMVPQTVQIMLRLLACANSCLNPIVYGYYYIVK